MPVVGGGKPDFLIDLPADSMYVPTGALAPAPSSNDVGSNVEDMPVCLCDGSTDEGREYVFRVPEDPDTSGSITVEWIAYSGAASPSGTLAFSIRFVPIADDGTESWDQAYGTTQTATAVTMDNQDRIETISKTFTYAAVGFTAGDLVKLQTWRDVSEDTMATDASWVHFRLRMPRT
nr:hypothetical protein 5 [Legionellales bacterium]